MTGTIGEQLKLIRINEGLTMEQFAAVVGKTTQTVYRWEKGAAYPSTESLYEIATRYKVILHIHPQK